MPRPKKSENITILETKIKQAKEHIVKIKARYDAALSELKELMDKRDAIRKEEIFTAIADSKYSYEEILNFINGKLRIAEE